MSSPVAKGLRYVWWEKGREEEQGGTERKWNAKDKVETNATSAIINQTRRERAAGRKCWELSRLHTRAPPLSRPPLLPPPPPLAPHITHTHIHTLYNYSHPSTLSIHLIFLLSRAPVRRPSLPSLSFPHPPSPPPPPPPHPPQSPPLYPPHTHVRLASLPGTPTSRSPRMGTSKFLGLTLARLQRALPAVSFRRQ